MKNKMQQKSQRKAELTENEKPAAVVAPITTGYTVKISNYGMACPSRHIQLFLPFMCIFFTGVSMLYNIVVSVVQHRESALGVLRSPLFGFPSYLGHHRHWVEFPVLYSQLFLLVYLFYTRQYIYVNPNPSHHHHPIHPWYLCLFSIFVCLIFTLQISSPIPFFSCWLTSSKTISESIHISANGTVLFLFMLSNIPLYICTTLLYSFL